MTKEDLLEKVKYRFGTKHMELFDEIIKSLMDEYAKQQAIAFIKWGIESGEIMGDNWGDAFIPGEEETLYDKFIEQQNK